MSLEPTQRMKVTITFEYDAPVFEDDPDDPAEIARFEQVEMSHDAYSALTGLAKMPLAVDVQVEPVMG